MTVKGLNAKLKIQFDCFPDYESLNTYKLQLYAITHI